MMKHNLTKAEELLLWYNVKISLELLRVEPPASRKEVDNLLALLPKRQDDESFRQWLERSQDDMQLWAFEPKAAESSQQGLECSQDDMQLWMFEPITEIIRLAADTSGSKWPLPDPRCALESQDGQFRLYISARYQGKIILKIEALGFAADKFARQSIGIAGGPSVEAVIARIELNEDGDGSIEIDDQPKVRKALLKPIIGKMWKKIHA